MKYTTNLDDNTQNIYDNIQNIYDETRNTKTIHKVTNAYNITFFENV